MKFAHLTFTTEEYKKLNLKVMTIKRIFRILNKMHEQRMKKYHRSYCPDAVWRDMQERCFIMIDGNRVLVFKTIFDKMLTIYKKKK